MADRDQIPDLWTVMDGLRDSLTELKGLGDAVRDKLGGPPRSERESTG